MNWPLAELLPHAGDMILLESIAHWDEDSILARCRVRDSLSPLLDDETRAWLERATVPLTLPPTV